MYAIVEIGGCQWRLEPGSRFDINRTQSAVGTEQTLEKVLLACENDSVHVGKPFVKGAKVICEVVEHSLGPKTISFKFRRRENYRRTHGHRQGLTRLLVKEIQLGEKRQVASDKQKAAGSKRRVAGTKQEAKTDKQKATSSKLKKTPRRSK